MHVKLISKTQSESNNTPGGDFLSPEELIVYIARVSNPGNQANTETAPRLISYLIKNKHWSPFEMVDMTVEIVTSRAIAQQILRHRSFSFQEFSQRYAAVTEMEPIQLRKQADTNRQSSSEEFDPEIAILPTFGLQAKASEVIAGIMQSAQNVYNEMIKAGVAKESARMILPLTTQTRIYMKGSVRSWIHYLQIRCAEHTQLEHRQVALEIAKIFSVEFPVTCEALFPS